MLLSRRGFLGSLFAAPAIVHINNIMPVRVLPPEIGLTAYSITELDHASGGGLLTIEQITREALRILRTSLSNAEVTPKLPAIGEPTRLSSRNQRQLSVDFRFDSYDRTLPLSQFSERIIAPAMANMARAMANTDYTLLKNKRIVSQILKVPSGVDEAHVETSNDLSMRGLTAYNMYDECFIARLDTLFISEQTIGNSARLLKLATPRGKLPG